MAKDDPNRRSKISWPRESTSHANQLSKVFKDNLTTIAETFAGHERVDHVSRKHIDESFAALARMGLHGKRWWQRSDTWTGCGAFLFGISFSMPDICGALGGFACWNEKSVSTLSVIALVVFAIFGAGLFLWARHHGSLPKKPGTA